MSAALANDFHVEQGHASELLCVRTNKRGTNTIVIEGRKVLIRLILDPEVGFGDAYSEGHTAVEGDVVGALETLYQSMQ